MSLLTLERRRTQIELLADVCKSHSCARIALRSAGAPATTFATRLLCLERNALWVEWPASETAQAVQPGLSAEVFFDHQGHRFAFTAQMHGRFERSFDALGERVALKLSLPSRIERKQQRESLRVSLAAVGPVTSRLTSMLDSERTLECRLLNLSQGGLAGMANWEAIDSLAIGEVFWAEFELPGDCEMYEFAVRLAHRRRRGKDPKRGILGLAFCGGDDQSGNREKLDRIRRFVARPPGEGG